MLVGSNFYLKAQNDVPRGIDFRIPLRGGHIGTSGYFDYVGQGPFKWCHCRDKPITEFLRTNGNLPQPSLFTPGNATVLRDFIQFHAANGYQPDHVVNGGSIFTPAGDWGLQV